MSTQHTDRELLELAAKAAGIELAPEPFHHRGPVGAAFTGGAGFWNPLHDDGDALRLAVRLGICLEFGDCADDSPVLWCGPGVDRRDWPMTPLGPDFQAATRRAIVRAAAAIGAAKEGGEK